MGRAAGGRGAHHRLQVLRREHEGVAADNGSPVAVHFFRLPVIVSIDHPFTGPISVST